MGIFNTAEVSNFELFVVLSIPFFELERKAIPSKSSRNISFIRYRVVLDPNFRKKYKG